MKYRTFENAREFVHSLQLKNYTQWLEYRKSGNKPSDIPSDPWKIYKGNGWVSWGDWLGTNAISPRKKPYYTFHEARKFVHSLKLLTIYEWRNYCRSGKKPIYIPSQPEKIYKNKGWVSKENWLGIKEEVTPFKIAREFSRTLGLKNQSAWKTYCKNRKRNKDIPLNPHQVYRDKGWVSWSDWLGTNAPSNEPKYLHYITAKKFVHTLNFKSTNEWKEYCQSKNKASNIPSNPRYFYKHEGWSGWREWLGPSYITRNIPYLPFEEARKFIRSQKIHNYKEWLQYCKSGNKPKDIPTNPNNIYRIDGWKGWGDWLGTGAVSVWKKNITSYRKAQKFVRSLNLMSQKDWINYCSSGKKPSNIPAYPEYIYANHGWTTWKNWLGLPRIVWRPFNEAREFIHSKKLQNTYEWDKYVKSGDLPSDIPKSPRRIYLHKGWISMGDWLGTGSVAPSKRIFLPFEAAREFVRTLRLKNKQAWNLYAKSGNRPTSIPSQPDKTYRKKGWISWINWLDIKKREFLPFEEARRYAQSLKLKSMKEWSLFCRSGNKPKNIPTCPNTTYKNRGWVSYIDWLGTTNVSTHDYHYCSFQTAVGFVHALGLKNLTAWHIYCKSGNKPNDIPYSPHRIYKSRGWKGWGDWLGTGRISNKALIFRSFEEARKYVHSLKLKGFDEWAIFSKSRKKPKDIPASPNRTYKNEGWVSWGDWVGTGFIATVKRVYLPYKEAQKFVHSLGLKNQKAWGKYAISGKKPKNIPSDPFKVYKNKGWVSYGDWLGNNSVAAKYKTFRSFENAREFVHSLNLKNVKAWTKYCKKGNKPFDIPTNPNRNYKNQGWNGWRDWLRNNIER